MTEQSASLFEQLVQPPVFIIGAARSGTTWVFDIFKHHPQVAAIYESWLFTRHNGFGALFSEAHYPPARSGLGRLIDRDALIDLVRKWAESVMSSAIGPEHRYLVEKSPSHIFAVPLIREIFPGARFIHVLRDGRDVAVSVLKASDSWQRSWKHSFGYSIRTAARAWRDAVRRAHREARGAGERFLEIRYEAVQQDPFDAYRRMFDFCEIPYDDHILTHIFDKTDFKKNYTPKDRAFRRSGRTGDWRSEFTLRDAFQYNKTAGDLLLELGYANDRRWPAALAADRIFRRQRRSKK